MIVGGSVEQVIVGGSVEQVIVGGSDGTGVTNAEVRGLATTLSLSSSTTPSQANALLQ